ncbi:MAG: hypothetical protein AAF226_14065, partial [Verrucomicrobiota bacterium]
MTLTKFTFPSPLLFLMGLALVGRALVPQDAIAQQIPDDLLDDPHVREEFGVNDFTTPSIRKIFDDLKGLRPLPYDSLQREIPTEPSSTREELALTLGFLLADGFFAVEAEQFLELEPIGRSLLKHAKVLGAGTKISSHTKALLEHGTTNDWNSLRTELSKTQKDVEKEMVLIRDVDAAHLISLGGWLRAFEIGCAASLDPFDPTKAKTLARPDIMEYFVLSLDTLSPRAKNGETLVKISDSLAEMQQKVNKPEQETFTEAEV